MREFKFRIWDENKKEFIPEDEAVTIRANDGSVDAYPRYEDGFVIQQFTGLLDKNNKKIYEGDIIKTRNGSYKIEWADDSALFECVSKIGGCRGLYYYALNKNEMIEVLGNILENPDLLK